MRPFFFPVAMVLCSLLLCGCVRREGRNQDCRWPAEPGARALRTSASEDRRHLAEDLEFAEELAVEYMDAHHGPRSGAFQSHEAAGKALRACLAELAGHIARSHEVDPKEVSRLFGSRNVVADASVIVPFLALYCLGVALLAGWLLRQYPPEDGWMITAIMCLVASLAFSIGGVLVGEQWVVLWESIRVGTGHLSYRRDRVPWVRYETLFFLACLGLFWVTAAIRYRMRQQRM